MAHKSHQCPARFRRDLFMHDYEIRIAIGNGDNEYFTGIPFVYPISGWVPDITSMLFSDHQRVFLPGAWAFDWGAMPEFCQATQQELLNALRELLSHQEGN